MVNTRSTSKRLEAEKPQVVTRVQEMPPPTPATRSDDGNELLRSCVGSIVKSELVGITKPAPSNSRHSVKSKIPSSSSNKQAQKKKLELEAAKAKARIEMELIDKQLAADLANLEEEYSPPSERSETNRASDIERWVEQSQQELEMQHATMIGNDKGKPQTSAHTDTDAPIQQLASALNQLVTSSSIQRNTHLFSRLSTSKDLPLFTGNTMEWLSFKQAYDESTELCKFSEKENLWRLRKSLRGPAQEAVSSLLVSGTSPTMVMTTLELQFGNPEVILSRFMVDIKKLSHLAAEYHREIVPFSVKIKNFVAAARALSRAEYLQGVEAVTLILSKLPTTLLSKWTDYSYPLISAKESPKSRLEILSDFLTEEAVKTSTCSASLLLQNKSDAFKRKQYDSVNNVQVLNKQSDKCRYCRARTHKLTECRMFKKALRKDRWLHVKRYGICYKCLLAHHDRATCEAPTCDINNCGQPHHRLLHYVPRQDTTNSVPVQVTETESPPETVNHINITNNSVFLKVVPINIHGAHGMVSATALLDDGSTVSLISSSLASQVGLRGRRECLRVRGAWDNTDSVCDTEIITITLTGSDKKLFTMNACIVDNLNLPKQSVNRFSINKFKHLKSISNCLELKQIKPQILIGQDNYHLLLPLELRTGSPNEPYATRTPLGWCLHGRMPASSSNSPCQPIMFVTDDLSESQSTLQEIHEEVRRSFSIEAMGIATKPRQNAEDLRAENVLERTAVLVDGQWQVGLPWKDEKCVMPDSYPTAICRLKGVEQKMKKNVEYAQRYTERINHLLQNNYAYKLDVVDRTPNTWYLPHFGVDNPNKRKLRLVFDAAAKTNGLCLNDYLLKGPDLLMSLFGIMLRFRENPIAVTGDIKDMFLRVKIRPEDQNALRFLYRKNEEPISTYVMSSLIFGANCSPFIAQYVKNKNAKLYVSSMPAAVDAICTQHYMDDYIDSLPDVTSAVRLVNDVTFIHKKGGFEIRNWTSNSKEVLNSLPKDSLANAAVNFKLGHQYDGERTLGLIWDPSDDSLRFDVSFKRIPINIINGTQRPTKRDVLRVVMSIFDVYGFLSPFTIIGKIILRDTWQQKISWDDCITDTIFDKWVKWISLLESLRHMRLPRYYPSATVPAAAAHISASERPLLRQPASSLNDPLVQNASCKLVPTTINSYTDLQLHIFCDASTTAMCAVAYWRWIRNDRTHVAFIASRCRVTPVKPVSMPRLELQAAVLAARMAGTLTKEHKMKPTRKYFWCDSSTVLCWIRNDSRNYKQYVAHRLGEIDEITKINEWRYVPTRLNLADIGTRESYDCSILQKQWMYGPAFLLCEESLWPKDFSLVEPEIKDKQSDIEYINYIQTEKINTNLPVPDDSRFSSWLRLLRTAAIVLKFIYKCRKYTYHFDDTMERAEVLLLKQSQSRSFGEEIHEIKNNKCVPRSSRILNLSPYLDDQGVLRVGGRIGAVTGVLPETKNPIILDGRSHIAKLIVRYYHHVFAHGNRETVVNEVKQKYWVTNLRPLTRTVTSQCMVCRIKKCKPVVPRMADLPSARVAHHQRPFTHCGVDLFGPMEVTIGRRREKRYGVLFTCMTVRAIHLEVAATLTTDSFIMALRRMAARRCWPQYMYSDNGTNLKGADKELKRSIQALDENLLRSEALNHGTKWTFIAPASPHWGGAWERLIRSVKNSLKIILRERAPKEETLNTLLAEIENIVNSRPLTHVSVDHNDPETLTPNHFLVGSSSSLPSIGIFDDSDIFLRKQWRTAQRLADMYWRRWMKEVLPAMIPRSKWQEEQRALQIGDVVMVVDPDGPRNSWPKGIVQEVFPGKDGRVRVVKIKTKSGFLVRSAARVARIPIADNEYC